LIKQADQVKQAELERLMNKLDLNKSDQKEIEQSFNRLKSVRDDAAAGSQGLLEALKRLFQLGD
jgi:glutamyl-tRNA reductase